MKKAVRVLLVLLAILVLVALVLLGVAEFKYGALRDAPRVSHETEATPATRVRIVVDPALAEGQIYQVFSDFTPPDQCPPEWAFMKLLPQEFAVLLDPDVALGEVQVRAFINERRLGPVIVDQARTGGLLGRLKGSFPQVQWDADGLTQPSRGTLLVKGTVPVAQPVLSKVSELWAGPAATDSLPIRGGHFLEAVFDNRDGGAFAVAGALGKLDMNAKAMQMAGGIVGKVYAMRIHADPVSTDEMRIQFRIESDPNSEENPAGTFQFFVELAMPNLAKMLEENYDLTLKGATEVDGHDMIGDYTLSGLDAVLERARLARK